MMRFEDYEIGDLVSWAKAGFEKGSKKGSINAAMKMVQIITTEIIPSLKDPPIDTRAYAAGWRVQLTEDGATVVNTMPYAAIIEFGARAENIKVGRKMIDALTAWVLRKGLHITPDSDKLEVRTRRAKNDEEKRTHEQEARNLAWAIAQKMRKTGIFNRDGTQGLRVGQKALLRVRPLAMKEIERAIAKQLKGG